MKPSLKRVTAFPMAFPIIVGQRHYLHIDMHYDDDPLNGSDQWIMKLRDEETNTVPILVAFGIILQDG